MSRRRAFSLTEIILALFLIVIAVIAFLGIFSNSSRQAVQSRNRTVAIVLANSLMDEVEAHPYGAPAPAGWAGVEEPVLAWVEGNKQEMVFHKKVTCQSFVNATSGDTDLVNITISWREGVGSTEHGVLDPQDNKVLQVQMPVWR